MSPRRLRNSMNRVAIIPPVGIHDPRRSRALEAGTEAEVSLAHPARSSSRVSQSARDLQEPRFERRVDRLQAVDADATFRRAHG